MTTFTWPRHPPWRVGDTAQYPRVALIARYRGAEGTRGIFARLLRLRRPDRQAIRGHPITRCGRQSSLGIVCSLLGVAGGGSMVASRSAAVWPGVQDRRSGLCLLPVAPKSNDGHGNPSARHSQSLASQYRSLPMNGSLSRRDFLGRTTELCAGAAVASLLARSALAAGPPRLPVTIRDATLRATGQANGWAALKRLGAEGFEAVVSDDFSLPNLVYGGKKYSVADDAGIRRLKADAAGAGQKITALCMANRFAERPDTEVQLGAKVAEAAQALGRGRSASTSCSRQGGPARVPRLVDRDPRAFAGGDGVDRRGLRHREPRRLDQRPGLSPAAPSGRRLAAAGTDAGHGQFLLVRPSAVEGLRVVRDVRSAGLPHALQEYPLSGRRSPAAAPDGLEVRRVHLPDLRG